MGNRPAPYSPELVPLDIRLSRRLQKKLNDENVNNPQLAKNYPINFFQKKNDFSKRKTMFLKIEGYK